MQWLSWFATYVSVTRYLSPTAPNAAGMVQLLHVWGANGNCHVGTSAPSVAAPIQLFTPAPNIPSMLPPQVAEQIRAAQQRAALTGQAPASWAIGAACQAVWAADGNWYPGLIEGVTAAGNFAIRFQDAESLEEVCSS